MTENKNQFGKIGVLMGGVSSEKDISMKSGKAVLQALKDAGCDVVAVEISTDDEAFVIDLLHRSEIDVAFIALHGCFGEDGKVQAILEKAEIPYTGPDVEASRLAFDKIKTQTLLRDNNILVPSFLSIASAEDFSMDIFYQRFSGFPVVVKPACEGSSIGVSIVKTEEKLTEAVVEAAGYGGPVLVEEFISGRELTVGIIGETSLPVVEIRPHASFFDFTAKYQKGETDYLVPAPLDESTARAIQDTALAVYRAVGCRHLSRVDLILSEKGLAYVLEINTIPGFTSTSLVPMAAQNVGINFQQLCLKLIGLAYGEKEKEHRSISCH